jgi:hypothetical protein
MEKSHAGIDEATSKKVKSRSVRQTTAGSRIALPRSMHRFVLAASLLIVFNYFGLNARATPITSGDASLSDADITPPAAGLPDLKLHDQFTMDSITTEQKAIQEAEGRICGPWNTRTLAA